jgi:uncharacterized membrane protein YgcG
MTEPSTDRARAANAAAAPKQRRKKIQPAPVFATGFVTFSLVLALLGWQVASGMDPSLGHGKQKPKIVHRSITRVVVKKVYDAPEIVYQQAPSSGSSSGGGSSSSYSSGYSSGYSGGGSSSSSSGGAARGKPPPRPRSTWWHQGRDRHRQAVVAELLKARLGACRDPASDQL